MSETILAFAVNAPCLTASIIAAAFWFGGSWYGYAYRKGEERRERQELRRAREESRRG